MARRAISLVSLIAVFMLGVALAWQSGEAEPGWQRGRGWGWIWGAEDEVGALNHMSDASRLAALSLVKERRVYDLGIRLCTVVRQCEHRIHGPSLTALDLGGCEALVKLAAERWRASL